MPKLRRLLATGIAGAMLGVVLAVAAPPAPTAASGSLGTCFCFDMDPGNYRCSFDNEECVGQVASVAPCAVTFDGRPGLTPCAICPIAWERVASHDAGRCRVTARCPQACGSLPPPSPRKQLDPRGGVGDAALGMEPENHAS